jgi:prepilin-type processing-associated H-X9-DG protein
VAPQPRRGILALLDQPTFDIRSLPPLPAGLNAFAVLSVDPEKTYDQIIRTASQTDPRAGDNFAQLEEVIRQRLGFELRKDVLAPLGPKFALYSQAPAAEGANPAMAVLGEFTGLTIAAQARDEALGPNLDGLVEAINRFIRSQQAPARRGRPDAAAAAVGFRKQDAKRPTYLLDLPEGTLPPPLLAMFRPTLELGKGRLVLAANTPAADRGAEVAGLPADRLWKPTGAFEPMARRLPGEMVFLSVSDPRETLPAAIEGLPMLAAQLNLLFPAVSAAREAARRAQCTNNLKQIGLALHNYVAANGTFPAPAITGKDGKPLLSWRVAILPYLEQQALYDRFHHDEPWDSPHNKPLIKEMPTLYLCPSRPGVAAGTTTYRVFAGPGALFEAGKTKGLAEVTDGASNTILVAEAREAVPWTSPDSDLPFDPKAPASLHGAGSHHSGGGFQVLMADGSVQFVGDSIDPKTLRSLITCSGGEVVDRERIPGSRRAQPDRRGGPLHVDANKIPRADELEPLLFPGSLAVVTDRDGIRIVSRESFPSISSPAASGVLAGLMLPAVQAAREAARRAQCTNNLKQIALAMHNYESSVGSFPRPATIGKDGKPLLSWRVAILPYLDQQALYQKFKLDEPWDSPNNKPLIDEMPGVYLCPSRTRVQPGTTGYRAFVGKGAIFERDRQTKIPDVTDGMSNTIMVVEASEAVPWTRPDSDLDFDPDAKPSLFGAGSPHPGGFDAMFADGSVRFISRSIDLTVFKSLITRAGGEAINRAPQ